MNAAIGFVGHVEFAMIAEVHEVTLVTSSMGNHRLVVGCVTVGMLHINLTQSEKFCWMRCMIEFGRSTRKMKTHMISFLL